jgi:hypothetical protein
MSKASYTGSQTERSEFEAVLGSRLFTRSPAVLRLAQYVGEKYFSGEAETVKEYTIAVDLFGRPEDFDPKQDSIVRVEAYRLRKKLDEYYKTEGREHTLRFTLEPGQYVPRFVALHADTGLEAPAPLPALAFRIENPPPERKRAARWQLRGILIAATLVICVSGYLAFRHATNAKVEQPTWRILCGAPDLPPFQSLLGFTWDSDHYFSGGEKLFATPPATINSAEVAAHTQREGNFSYDIPLPASTYELRLYFGPRLARADALDPVQTHRFDVFMNGSKIMDALDPGNARPTGGEWNVRAFRDVQPASDGKLHLRFRNAADKAYVSAIEISPGLPGRMVPIRMIAKPAPFTDASGKVWSPERYVEGGKLVVRSDQFPAALDSNIYSGERYGRFRYRIPLPPGRYTVRLYFAETWFGTASSSGGVGSRRFDVYANSVPLLQDFDIYKAAGRQSYHAVVKEFHGLQPDAEGYIELSFVPRVNFACVNALELFQE